MKSVKRLIYEKRKLIVENQILKQTNKKKNTK